MTIVDVIVYTEKKTGNVSSCSVWGYLCSLFVNNHRKGMNPLFILLKLLLSNIMTKISSLACHDSWQKWVSIPLGKSLLTNNLPVY